MASKQKDTDKEIKEAKASASERKIRYWESVTKARYSKEDFYTKMMVNFSAGGIVLLLAFVGLNDIANITPMLVSVGLLGAAIISIFVGMYCCVEAHDAVLNEISSSKEGMRKDIHLNKWSHCSMFLYVFSSALVLAGLIVGLIFILTSLS